MVQMGLIWLILNKITHITSLNQAKRDAAVKSSLWNKDTDQYILLQCSVQFSHSVVSDSFQPHGLQHARPPCPSPSSCPLSSWCHPTISSSVVPFSSCFQSFPASGSLRKSQLFASGGQSIGVSVSASVLSMDMQGWFPVGLTGCSPRDSRESSPTPQFKSINFLALSLFYGPNLSSIHDHWKNDSLDYMDLCWQSDLSAF